MRILIERKDHDDLELQCDYWHVGDSLMAYLQTEHAGLQPIFCCTDWISVTDLDACER